METKLCSKCGVEKALCEFHRHRTSAGGYRRVCKDCRKAYAAANKERIAKTTKTYREANKDKIRERRKVYREANKEKISAKHRTPAYKQRRSERRKERRQEDCAYRLRKIVSKHVWAAIKKQGSTKGGSTFSALPYTPSDLVEHIEKQFDETMTWENYGTYWEVDHIYPQSLLPYDSFDHPNFHKCWALDNLQPLEKSVNRAKSNKILDG